MQQDSGGGSKNYLDVITSEMTRRPQPTYQQLRKESPVMLVSRVTTRDTEIGGCPVHGGDEVYVLLGSGNIDSTELAFSPGVRSVDSLPLLIGTAE